MTAWQSTEEIVIHSTDLGNLTLHVYCRSVKPFIMSIIATLIAHHKFQGDLSINSTHGIVNYVQCCWQECLFVEC